MRNFVWITLVLVTLLIFNLWISHSAYAKEFYPSWLGFLDLDVKVVFVFWGLVFIGNIFKLFFDLHKDKIAKLEREKNTKIELLVAANEQFFSYRLRDTILSVFRSYVDSQPYVIGVQLYEYQLKFTNNKSNIQLTFVDGYTADNISVNATLQTQYSLNMEMYREFIKAYEACSRPIEKSIDEALAYPPEDVYDISLIVDFIKKYGIPLTKRRQHKTFTYDDAMAFALVDLANRILERTTGIALSINLRDNARNHLVSIVKRTGYLQAVLSNFPVTFSHTGLTDKANREYITSKIRINGENYVYMILLDPSVAQDENRLSLLNDLAFNFESLMDKKLNRVYNKENIPEGDDDNDKS